MKNKTAFADTASDKLSRLNMRKEGLFDLIVEKESDLKEGPYRGFIVEAEKMPKSNRVKAYIRIPKIHDHILPIPCDKTYNPQQNKALKSMLLVAISRTDTHDENTDEEEVVDYKGKEVEITFINGSPKQQGKMRGATITFISETVHKDAQYCYLKDDGNAQAMTDLFKNSSVTFFKNLGRAYTPGKISNGKIIKGDVNLNWTELKQLGKSKIFETILANIAKHESKNSYDAYNRGDSGDSMGQEPIIKEYGAKLSELTIATITDKVMKEKKIGGKSVFAVGKYQIVPHTLRNAIDAIEGCDTNEVYGPDQQEAFACYLILMKRPKLGKYLLGDTKITAERAQLAMAQEWAGIRVIGYHVRPEKKKKYTWYKEQKLVPGNSYYKNYDNWRLGKKKGKMDPKTNPPPRKDSNPDDIQLERAKATAKAIEATRQALDKDPIAQRLAKKISGGA